jgi:hypothetical protein
MLRSDIKDLLHNPNLETDKDLAVAFVEAALDNGISVMEMVLAVGERRKKEMEKREYETRLGMDAALSCISRIHFKGLGRNKINLLDPTQFPQNVWMMRGLIADPEKVSYYGESIQNFFKHAVEAIDFDKYLAGDSADWAKQTGNYEYIMKLKKWKDLTK